MPAPTEKDGYLIVARDLLQGVVALSSIARMHPRSCAMLAAHSLECGLKAYLWHVGRKAEINDHKIRHDLLALWKLAYHEGLGISESPPPWCVTLSAGHGPNYYFRYQQGENKKMVHGGATPKLLQMSEELGNLIELVAHSTVQ